MPNFVLNSFGLGMNRLTNPTKLQVGEYHLGVNVRNRYDVLEPVHKPAEENLILVGSGKVQGIYGFWNYSLLFRGGQAFYKDHTLPGNTYAQIPGFQMSSTAEFLYAEAVPAATVLGVRKLDATSNTSPIKYLGVGSGNPACVVVQDGQSQPWIIFPDGTARQSSNYNDWTQSNREYVPIGKQMLYYSGVLYVVSPDGQLIYRSVTGRPLDFMVIIDINGDKLATEAEGGASNVSHRVAYDQITAIKSVGVAEGSFCVTTIFATYLVTPITSTTIYGEPIFRTVQVFSVGAVNQFSVIDLLGDTAQINFAGLTTFNAVLQTRNEGRNAPFSAKIQDLLDGIVQTNTCAIEHDNFAYFSVTTKFGRGVLVYDMVKQVYCGIDIYSNVNTIKQFASVRNQTTRKLLFITIDDKLYEAEASADLETASVYIGEFSSNDPANEKKPEKFRLIFTEVAQSGTVFATAFVDRVEGTSFSQFVKSSSSVLPLPISPPFGSATEDTEKPVSWDIGRLLQGWKFGFWVSWAFHAKLSNASFVASDVVSEAPLEQQTRTYSDYAQGAIVLDSFSPDTGAVATNIHVYGTNLQNVVAISVHGVMSPSFVLHSDTHLHFPIPAGASTDKIVLHTAEYQVESTTNLTVT